jgi:hypothetical protein
MSDLIPFIHQEEVKRIKSEIEGEKVSVVFYGTTRLGEAMAIIIRYRVGYSAVSHSYVTLSQEFYWGGDCTGVTFCTPGSVWYNY